MKRFIATGAAALLALATAAPTRAASVCVGSLSDVEMLHRVKQDAYFTHNAPVGKRLRVEYDGCGYRIHVGENSPASHNGDLLLVDRQGHVTRVVHQR
jgi:hypothetical protein